MRFRELTALCLSSIIAAGTGCTDDPVAVDPVPDCIEVHPDLVILEPGRTVRFTATVFSTDDEPIDALGQWATSNAATAQIDTTGLLQAVADGNARVSFEAAGLIGFADVVVVTTVP